MTPERLEELRHRITDPADLSIVAHHINPLILDILLRLNEAADDPIVPLNAGGIIYARALIARACLQVAASWWTNELKGPPLPEAWATLLDLMQNPPPEVEGNMVDLRTGEEV